MTNKIKPVHVKVRFIRQRLGLNARRRGRSSCRQTVSRRRNACLRFLERHGGVLRRCTRRRGRSRRTCRCPCWKSCGGTCRGVRGFSRLIWAIDARAIAPRLRGLVHELAQPCDEQVHGDGHSEFKSCACAGCGTCYVVAHAPCMIEIGAACGAHPYSCNLHMTRCHRICRKETLRHRRTGVALRCAAGVS